MKLRPKSWVVSYRFRWYERVLLGYSVLVGLFFAMFCFGGLGFIVYSTMHGTLLEPRESRVLGVCKYGVIAFLQLWFGAITLRWAFGSLIDLFGAEVVLYGQVEELTVRRGRSTSRVYRSAVVGGQWVELDAQVYATLAKGDWVWMRVGRFKRGLKELARPDTG